MSNYSPPIPHPGWCDPRSCHDTASDRQHCSELTPLRLREGHLTLAWVQADEFLRPDQPGTPELRIDVTHGMAGHDTTLYLRPREVHRLAHRLITEYHRQAFLSAPVVHAIRAGA